LNSFVSRSPQREAEALASIIARVPRTGVLVVHSAIGKLSRQGFRAEAMIEAFMDHMREGTLVMPTMTWRTVSATQPYWDEIETASETGVLTEIFRKRYASHRSIHPTHSVAALGAVADILVSRHHFDHTPVSENSPHGLMRSYDSHVLMLGVGLEACTAIHLPEELAAPDLYLRPLDPKEVYFCRDRNGHVHRMQTRRHWRLNRDFPKFGPRLRERGLMQAGAIGDCSYFIVALRDLLEVVNAAVVADPRGTLRDGEEGVPTSDRS
jgi:aminoglycoside 3-N-acetyltransferase